MGFQRIARLACSGFLLAVMPFAQGQIFEAQPNPIVSVAVTSVDPLISDQTGPHSSVDSSRCPGVPIGTALTYQGGTPPPHGLRWLPRREGSEDMRRIATDRGEERPSRPGGLPPALFPVTQRPHVHVQ